MLSYFQHVDYQLLPVAENTHGLQLLCIAELTCSCRVMHPVLKLALETGPRAHPQGFPQTTLSTV